MIKVLVGYKLKPFKDIEPILLKLRSMAMTYPGFVGAEILRNRGDGSIINVVNTWANPEDWKAWENSLSRKELLRQAEDILVDEPRVTVWRVLPTVGW